MSQLNDYTCITLIIVILNITILDVNYIDGTTDLFTERKGSELRDRFWKISIFLLYKKSTLFKIQRKRLK